jgi:hypothetical protein
MQTVDFKERSMTKRLVTGTLMALVAVSTVVSADEGAANRAAARSTRPIWTFVGIGAGFGTGLWAGLTAFDDSINSDRKVWTSAIIGAAAGGILGYVVDRHRAKSGASPARQPALVSSPDERSIVSASRRLGDGQLRRWLDAGILTPQFTCVEDPTARRFARIGPEAGEFEPMDAQHK